MKNKVTLLSYLLILIITILLIVIVNIYSNNNNLKTENQKLKNTINYLKQDHLVYGLTKTFIEATSNGKQESMLTGKAKNQFEDEQKSISSNAKNHTTNLLDHVDIENISVDMTGENTAKTYAIYKVYYNSSSSKSDISQQRILFLTLRATWTKVHNTYKVTSYKIDLLKDNLDEILKKMSSENKS